MTGSTVRPDAATIAEAAVTDRWRIARAQSGAARGTPSAPAALPNFSVALFTDSTGPYPEVVHTLALAEALASCGHRVTVWAPGAPGVNEFHRHVDAGVATRVVPVRRSAPAATCIEALRRAFDPAFFDVVHAHGWLSAAAVGPCVHTVHRLQRPASAELGEQHDRVLRAATGHVCSSPGVAAELRTNWGIKPTLIPEGVNAARFARAAAPGPAAVAARGQWRHRLGKYLLTVAEEVPAETTHTILSALAELSGPAGGLRLVIAHPPRTGADRPRRDSWRRASATTGVPVIRPAMLGPDLPALVAAATAFIAPAGIHWPHPGVLQALAADVPVVLHGPCAPPAVLQSVTVHTRNRADLAGAVAAVTDAPSAERREAGRSLAAKHPWTLTATAHLELYLADSARRVDRRY
jgi:glycosyltransferase involved in cell wall biosynthesis